MSRDVAHFVVDCPLCPESTLTVTIHKSSVEAIYEILDELDPDYKHHPEARAVKALADVLMPAFIG